MSAFDIIESDMFDGKTLGQTTERKATARQIDILKRFYQGNTLNELLAKNNLNNLEEISLQKASDLIKKINEIGGKQNEQ